MKSTLSRNKINYWPSLIDMMMTILIVIILLYYLTPERFKLAIIDQKQGTFKEYFEHEFKEEKKISIKKNFDYLLITFGEEVLFSSSDYHLKLEGKKILNKFANVLKSAKQTGYTQIQIEGHTDSTQYPKITNSYPANNWQLSSARALSVVEYLSEKSFLNPKLLSANGYGEFNPVANNDSPEERTKNRRIEIKLFFSSIK